MYIAITGRETNLALAELEAVFGQIASLSKEVVGIELENLSYERLEHIGFTKKFAQTVKESVSLDVLANEIANAMLGDTEGTSKLSFGISWYCNKPANRRSYLDLAKKVKKQIQAHNRSARFIQPKEDFALNAAQIHYNNLFKKGCEIILYGNAYQPSIAITRWAFNPSLYSHRDYDRPARSAKVGMFPPKLAQVLINLASPKHTDIICDPFCGSGVVLQEGMYAGYNVVGSDNSEDMVVASQKNLDWFSKEFHPKNTFVLSQGDARNFTAPKSSFVVVSEGYLGPGLSEKPNHALLQPITTNLEKLYLDFFKCLVVQPNKPRAIVITLPFWQTTTGISYLNVIDQITDLGYTIRQFNSVNSAQLLYRRSQQIVGRQVLVVELKKTN